MSVMINPTAPLNNEVDARASARASAIGMVVGAINVAAEGWYAANGGAESGQRMIENLTGQVQTAEQVEQAIQFGWMSTAFFIVLHFVLAGVQWKKPNQILPILFLVLIVWGLGTGLLALVAAGQTEALGVAARPAWLVGVGFVTLLVAGLLHIVGIRGASALSKLRQAN